MKVCRYLLPIFPAVCLVACSGSGDSAATANKAAAESMSPDPIAMKRVKSGDLFDDDYKKIQAKYGSVNDNVKDGKVLGAGKKFEGFDRENSQFNKEFKGKDVTKKSWWGDRDYVKKVYEGKKDANSIRKDSRFNGESAREGKFAARDGDRTYKTNDYSTGNARENAGKSITKQVDAETEERRRVFTEPNIIPWQTQNGMTVDDTKRMLGR